MDRLTRIHKRQIARLLDHLKRTGQYTPELEKDIKRSFGYVFEDVADAVKHGHDKESGHEQTVH